jgi:hypothetical protein
MALSIYLLLSRRRGNNFLLHLIHLSHAGPASIIEPVQMEQTVHKIQTNLVRDRVLKPARLAASDRRTYENLTVLKRQHVSRSAFAEELSM